MTPLRARMTFIAFTGLCLGTAANALLMQERPVQGPTTSVSITQFGPVHTYEAEREVQNTSVVPEQPTEATSPQDKDQKLRTAFVRELIRKGYNRSLALSANALPSAVLVYQYDSGLPLTGEASEDLLKKLIFDLSPAPRGPFADRAESDGRFVLEVQNALLGLGFFSGALSGHMDSWTQNAVKAFQRHRKLPQDGRLNEATILELIAFSGQVLRKG